MARQELLGKLTVTLKPRGDLKSERYFPGTRHYCLIGSVTLPLPLSPLLGLFGFVNISFEVSIYELSL